MEEGNISTAQIRMIFGLARKCNMDDDALHTLVEGITQKDSIKALTSYQASRVIERLKTLAEQEDQTKPVSANRATEAQRRKIYALAREMGWMDNPKRLRKFLEARFGVADVSFLTAAQSGAVIEALKAMRDGGRGERKKADNG